MRSLVLAMFVVLLLGSSFLAGCSLVGKKESVVTIAQVPSPVRAAIEKLTAGASIKAIEKIEWNGKVTYEVEYQKDGKQLDAFFTEDGNRVERAMR